MSDGSSYAIISPVKDESRFIARTLETVVAQTHRPALWLIVDDGSSDGTREIVSGYAERFDWIRLMSSNRTGNRQTGSAEIIAFNIGAAQLDL
ncbi:MAG: glycosyltransferase, partial [Chitinivibrionales bacterium]|nr:glycosyltransferase [Chitinivibrionales bacterium]